MFKTHDQQLGILLTNPNQITREQKLMKETLIALTTEIINLKKENESLKYFSSNPINNINAENFLSVNSLGLDNNDIQEYENFFTKHANNLTNLIVTLIKNKDNLNKTATIGPEKFNMFSGPIDKKSEPDVFVGNSDSALSSNPKDFFQIDFESKRPLNQHSTDFVSNIFLVDKSKYLHFVISAFDLLVNLIKQIDSIADNFETVKPIMKGGNLLKLFFEKISKDFNSQINDYLQTKFGKNFSSSDFDFDFKFKPNANIDLDLYNEQRVFVSNLLSIYMIAIRNILFENKSYFFNFYKLNQKTQQKHIMELIEQYNESIKQMTEMDKEYSKVTGNPRKYSELDGAVITGLIYDYDPVGKNYISQTVPGQTPFTTGFVKKDYHIINDATPMQKKAMSTTFYLMGYSDYFNRLKINPNDKNLSDLAKSMVGTNFFYNTTNINVAFGETEFSLLRIKVNFIGQLKLSDGTKKLIQLPGELLDLSLAKINDYKLRTAKPEYYTNFLIRNINKTIGVQSLSGLINEITVIIFTETNNTPWIDNKYGKRLIRLILLITLKLLYSNDNIEFKNKIIACEEFINSVNANFTTNLNLTSTQTQVFHENLAQFYVEAKNTYEKHGASPNYLKFKDVLTDILGKMTNVLKLHYNFTLKKGNVHKITYLDGFK